MRRPLILATILGLVTGLGLAGCHSSDGRSISLYTHCGIRDVKLDNIWFTRVGGVLDDGNGNPPAGWGNPEQDGWIELHGDRAVFTDDHGHTEFFQPTKDNRPTAICR